MGAEEGGDNAHLALVRQRAGRAQHLHFVVERKAVTGFDLHRAGAIRDQRVEAGQGGSDKRILRCRACRFHRRNDSAAGLGDLFIGCARQPHLEFARAVAGINKVRVAIDQPRRDPAPAAIDLFGGIERRRVGLRPGIDDAPALRRHNAAFDNAEARPLKGRQPCIVPKRFAVHRPEVLGALHFVS